MSQLRRTVLTDYHVTLTHQGARHTHLIVARSVDEARKKARRFMPDATYGTTQAKAGGPVLDSWGASQRRAELRAQEAEAAEAAIARAAAPEEK